MDVGIITIHNHHNYGAVLQAYALNRAVRRLGHQCKTIDCNIDPGTGRGFKWSRHPGAQITSFYNVCRSGANRRYDQRFRNFSKQEIPMTDTTYESLEQLITFPPQFDAYITGSDQVWRPTLLDQRIGEAFHLSFVSPEKARLISYAPSFGVSEIQEIYSEKIKRYLMRYHWLSAREKRGREIIFELSGRKAEQVLDPTLLLSADEYEEITNTSAISGEYVLVYPMELGKDQNFLNLVKKIKKRISLPLVCVLPLDFDFRWLLIADKVILDAGPKEFLGLFKYASFVCTNSFHGTVFSIMYRKNFLGYPHSISNTRIHSLLERVDLLGRQITDLGPQNIQNKLDDPINYSAVIPRLKDSVDQSLTYLKMALDS